MIAARDDGSDRAQADDCNWSGGAYRSAIAERATVPIGIIVRPPALYCAINQQSARVIRTRFNGSDRVQAGDRNWRGGVYPSIIAKLVTGIGSPALYRAIT